jgi:hypothetical protein
MTLTEVLIASTLLTLVSSVTMSAVISVVKTTLNTQNTGVGVAEVRYAGDFITKYMRASPITPRVIDSPNSAQPNVDQPGCIIELAPNEGYYACVDGATVIDTPRNIKGVNKNQDTIIIASNMRHPVAKDILTGTCPSSSISSPNSHFSTTEQPITLSEMFAIGNSITIPGTKFGSSQTRTIKTISGNSIVLTANLTHPIPNGTPIPATNARKIRFEVAANGELRFYRDARDLTAYSILAREISADPRVDAHDSASALTKPFVYNPGTRVLKINFQRLPAGSQTGRSETGLSTKVQLRTDPRL